VENLLKKSRSVEDTLAIAHRLAVDLRRDKTNVFFWGDLGAGKTAFIKGLCSELGVSGSAVSPTFQLIRRYSGAVEIIHMDLYRLKDITEILHLGWHEILESSAVVAVEWADRAYEILPQKGFFVNIRHVSKEEREIEICTEKKDISWNRHYD